MFCLYFYCFVATSYLYTYNLSKGLHCFIINLFTLYKNAHMKWDGNQVGKLKCRLKEGIGSSNTVCGSVCLGQNDRMNISTFTIPLVSRQINKETSNRSMF